MTSVWRLSCHRPFTPGFLADLRARLALGNAPGQRVAILVVVARHGAMWANVARRMATRVPADCNRKSNWGGPLRVLVSGCRSTSIDLCDDSTENENLLEAQRGYVE